MGVESTKENPPVSPLFTLSCRRMVCVSGVPTVCLKYAEGLSHSDLAAWGAIFIPISHTGGAETSSILRGGEEPCLPPPPQ